MVIKSVSFQNIKKAILFTFVVVCIFFIIYFSMIKKINKTTTIIENTESYINDISDSNEINDISEYLEDSEKNISNSYIKWVDFKGTAICLSKLANLDIKSHIDNSDIKYNWIELMSYLACKYGGDFSKFKQSDLDKLITDLKSGKTIDELSKDYKLYNYYYESYDAIFHEYIGNYTIQVQDNNGNKTYETSYGLKVFSPIASGYSFSHYKDFGTSRSYGYKRVHLGNDLLRKYRNSNSCC